jgi:hypothetical protein
MGERAGLLPFCEEGWIPQGRAAIPRQRPELEPGRHRCVEGGMGERAGQRPTGLACYPFARSLSPMGDGRRQGFFELALSVL